MYVSLRDFRSKKIKQRYKDRFEGLYNDMNNENTFPIEKKILLGWIMKYPQYSHYIYHPNNRYRSSEAHSWKTRIWKELDIRLTYDVELLKDVIDDEFYTKKYHHMLRWMSAINQSIPFRERNVQEEWIKFYNKRKKGDEV